jgi:hypothetical protein
MLSLTRVIVIASAALVATLTGCGASRQVEAKGEVTSPISTPTSVMVTFYDLPTDGSAARQVDQVKLGKVGAFDQKIDVEGAKIRLFALDDADGNGACTEGESWASAEVIVKDDNTIEPVSLALRSGTCPVEEVKAAASGTN